MNLGVFHYMERVRKKWCISVESMCSVLHVARTTYYSWKHIETDRRQFVYVDLVFLINYLPPNIRKVWIKHRCDYPTKHEAYTKLMASMPPSTDILDDDDTVSESKVIDPTDGIADTEDTDAL